MVALLIKASALIQTLAFTTLVLLINERIAQMTYLCANCLTEGKPKSHTKGSFVIEIFLWLCFIVPGLIYSLWRLTTRANVCRTCLSPELVPSNSPRANLLRKNITS